jgi:hypothetical protein
MRKARPFRGLDGPSPSRILGGFLPGTVRSRSRKTTAAPIGYHRRACCEPGQPDQDGEVERFQSVTV